MLDSLTTRAADLWRSRVRLYPSLPKHLRVVMAVEGTLSAEEADLLYKLAAKVDEGAIVEIGSYRGKSTIALALGSEDGRQAPVYAIDPHETFVGVLGGAFGPQDRVAFFRNTLRAGCAGSINLINLRSSEAALAWRQPIGLLWIDGDHSYEGVRADVDGFASFLLPSAVIAFHDSTDPQLGPARVITEMVANEQYHMLSGADRTTVLQKAGGHGRP